MEYLHSKDVIHGDIKGVSRSPISSSALQLSTEIHHPTEQRSDQIRWHCMCDGLRSCANIRGSRLQLQLCEPSRSGPMARSGGYDGRVREYSAVYERVRRLRVCYDGDRGEMLCVVHPRAEVN